MTLQNAMKVVIDQRIAELKNLLERTPQMPTVLAMQSTSRTPLEDSMTKGRTQFVCILLASVRLPSGSLIDETGFIEVNLIDIPTETLQLVRMQVHEELHEIEYSTDQRKK